MRQCNNREPAVFPRKFYKTSIVKRCINVGEHGDVVTAVLARLTMAAFSLQTIFVRGHLFEAIQRGVLGKGGEKETGCRGGGHGFGDIAFIFCARRCKFRACGFTVVWIMATVRVLATKGRLATRLRLIALEIARMTRLTVRKALVSFYSMTR